MPALLLDDSTILPAELFKYKIIVTSYNRVVAEQIKMDKFLKDIKRYKSGKSLKVPKRPIITLLSDVFRMDGVRSLGPYIGLDEAHTIKNPRSRAFAAIQLLRSTMFKTCIMLTGDPLDNKWTDAWAPLAMLTGHPLDTPDDMRKYFTNPAGCSNNSIRTAKPTGRYLARLIQLMDAVTLRRPSSIVTDTLPPLYEEVVWFRLPPQDLKSSNETFMEYDSTRGAGTGDTDAASGDKEGSMVKWSSLIRAQQIAYHRRLADIMKLERKAMQQRQKNENKDVPELTDEDQKMLDTWRDDMTQGDNYRSPRIDTILDVVNRHRDVRPDDIIAIMDESVFFLDLVQIAINKLEYPRVQCFRYDGRIGPAERDQVIADLLDCTQPKILLATRGTGGLGLNFQFINVLVRCGPWWKRSWEAQARARFYRQGQLRPVFCYEIAALGCEVEKYKRKTRNAKNKLNEKIMLPITRRDDQVLEDRRTID